MSTLDTFRTARGVPAPPRRHVPARRTPRLAGAPDREPGWFRWLAASPAAARSASLVGLVLGLVAFAVEPLAIGAFGITAGLLGKHAGDRLGRVAVAVSMLGVIVGPVLSSTVYALLLAP